MLHIARPPSHGFVLGSDVSLIASFLLMKPEDADAKDQERDRDRECPIDPEPVGDDGLAFPGFPVEHCC